MKPQSDRVQLQQLRNFTVQIRHPETGDTVGTGVVVSTDGKILTCAHVIRDCSVDPRKLDAGPVKVYFPQDHKDRLARVSAFLPEHEDDVVLLQVEQLFVPFGSEQIAVLGTAAGSEGNPFRSYVYSPIGDLAARYVRGTVMGPVEGNAKLRAALLLDLVQLDSRDIRPGASGAAVLDENRNLVVGLITSRWNPAGASEDDNIGWATDTEVLGFRPFDFVLRVQGVPLIEAPRSDLKVDQARLSASVVVHNPQEERSLLPGQRNEYFVGREDLLQSISSQWTAPRRRVTNLVGPAGIGKTALARESIEQLLAHSSLPKPDRVFWYSFSDRADADLFFEKALSALLGENAETASYPSVAAKAQLLAALLPLKRFLFVLDGLDVLQSHAETPPGLLENDNLRDFLLCLAGPKHQSYCLITSRLPVLDLIDFTTYGQLEVPPFSASETRELLLRLNIAPSQEIAKAILDATHGRPASLLWAASNLRKTPTGLAKFDQEILLHQSSSNLTFLDAFSDRQAPLSDLEAEVLAIVIALRIPPTKHSLRQIFASDNAVLRPLAEPSTAAQIDSALDRLTDRGWLTYDQKLQTYVPEAFLRSPALITRLEKGPEAVRALHARLARYYLSPATELPFRPSLADLEPLAEAVHHSCRAGRYREAYQILEEQIYRGKRRLLVNELGAWEAALTLLSNFFPDGDTSREPLLDDAAGGSWLLNEAGLALGVLGQLRASASAYNRSLAVAVASSNWRAASTANYNLAELLVYQGKLSLALEAARSAADFAASSGEEKPQWISMAARAWITQLGGQPEQAGPIFDEAERIRGRVLPHRRSLTGLSGIWQADYLRRMGKRADALAVTKANRTMATRYRWSNQLSRCHRVLGDLRADAQMADAARLHYDKAVEIARTTSNRTVLIEALLARGRWMGRTERKSQNALTDLRAALEPAISGEFRLHEADIRIAMAWTYLGWDRLDDARAEAQRARGMSREMSYYWGSLDAQEILSKLPQRG